MKKYASYIVGILISFFSLIPPIDFRIEAPGEYWPLMVLISGFLGFWICFLKTHWIVKVVAVGGIINAFLSVGPVISFTAYFSLLAACYFYALCYSIDDFKPVFKMLQCLLIFHALMFVMQFLGKDVLLNFSSRSCFGVVGQHMQSASYSVILAASLMPYSRINIGFPVVTSFICNSVGGFMSCAIGFSMLNLRKKYFWRILISSIFVFLVLLFLSGKFESNINPSNGRFLTWTKSIQLSMEHFLTGWGIGSYKYIFPSLCGIQSIPWKTAHNCWIQILFEVGAIGFTVIAGYFLYLFIELFRLLKREVYRPEAIACLCGLAMITSNMMVHFPTRMIQSVLIIVFFLAYCQKAVDNGKRQDKYC